MMATARRGSSRLCRLRRPLLPPLRPSIADMLLPSMPPQLPWRSPSPSCRWNGGFPLSHSPSQVSGHGGSVIPQSVPGPEEAVRSPVDMAIAVLDMVHDATGMPWWLTIVGFSIAVRMLLLPLIILQQKRVTKILSFLPWFPFAKPLRGSERSIKEQLSLFAKKYQELNCPNPLWFVATPVVQIPLFLVSMIAVRRMALEKHSGFDCGGMLWFADLTTPGHGVVGSVLPLILSATYLANIKISFKDAKFRNTKIGTVFLFWSWWLEASSVLVFGIGLYLPQAAQIYWMASNMCNLIQSVWLNKFRKQLIHGLRTAGAGVHLRSSNQSNYDTYETLLVTASQKLEDHQLEKAIDLFKSALKENPERPEAYGGLGKAYLLQKEFSEAEVYYRHAIAKGTTNDILIVAYSGTATALFQQGKMIECIENLKTVRSFEVPKDPLMRISYYRALVMLASALSQQGKKKEALEVLNDAVTYDKNISRYIEQLQEEIGQK